MDGKIEQCVCIKFCVKLGKSATEIFEIFREAFGEHPLSRTVDFEWHSCFKASQVSVEDDERSGRPPAKRQKMLKKFKNSFTKSIAVQSTSSQTPLESVMEFARRS
jgi:hypothetical protein